MKPLISLDVFDTAIFRKVFYPTDIFDLVEEEIGSKTNFKALRIEAQNKARRKDTHYTILDIYKYIPRFNPKEEIKAELFNCEANPYILDLYNNPENDYIFISDMYLPSSVIKAMLERCGYKNPQVFVSCEYRALKGDGSLFRKVQTVLGREISKHIGDNYGADIKGAQKAKISEAEYVGCPCYERKIQIPELKSQKLRKFLINVELNSNFSIEEKIGYMFSPLALSFTKKVLEEAKDSQSVFFNARDSYILYIIARFLLKTNKKIKYCRFSRKSCQFPNINTNYMLDASANIKVMNFFRSLRIQKLRDFTEMFELEGTFKKELNELNITLDTFIDYSKDKNNTLLKFVKLIQPILYEKAKKDRKKFLKYIENIEMKNNDIFVDLGHFGSMQSIIRKIAHISLKGRYVHLFKTTEDYFKDIKEDKTSFLPVHFLALYTGIVELIFSEPNGTVITYTDEGSPILNEDTKFRKDVSRKILRGLFKGAKKLIEEDIKIPYEDILKVIMRFLEQPTLEEAKFGNSKLFENGSYSENESIVWFDEEYIRKGRLKDCYSRSYWKPAFKVLLRNHEKYYNLERFLK